jgi:flagellin-like hook-associated protein FlgL
MNIAAHNILAMNAQRMYGINTNTKKKSSEKLSSGYRINRAADDAAGLSISEKMRKRIRGLNQGADNLKDGVSLCQTADGALMEVEDMIHRMNELAIKAANGTNSQSDREDINAEISELKSEMTRVFNTTKFNEIHLFKAPYIPDIVGEPTDYEMFNGPDGVTPAGVLVNNKRYTFSELGVPSYTGEDWTTEITDPDNPEELIRFRLNAGDSPENLHRVYVMSADDTGIKINNLYAGYWDSTIRQDGKTISFSYRGMDISFEAESDNRTDIIDRLRADGITENSWDAIPITGIGNKAVTSGQDNMVYNVTNSNKNEIDNWKFQIQADNEGVGIIQTVGDDGLTHTKTKWADFTNTRAGDPFPIADWGSEDEGNNPVTMSTSATYQYTDQASAAYLTNTMTFAFRFLENEVSKAQAINGLTQDIGWGTISSPIANVAGDSGVTVTSSNVTGFYFQRDKLLRDFGDAGSSAPMTLTVERNMVKDGTVTDHEWRLELSRAYAKRIDNYTDRRITTYSAPTEVVFYDSNGQQFTPAPGSVNYDDSIPDQITENNINRGQETSYVLNTGLSADWSITQETPQSSVNDTESFTRELTYQDGGETKTGSVVIKFGRNTEVKRTTNSSYEKSGTSLKNYVENGSGGYKAASYNTYYVMDDTNGTATSTGGDKYRAAGSADSSATRYVQTGGAYKPVKSYDLEHYTYVGKNGNGEQAMARTANNPKFLITDSSASSIRITNSDGSTTWYNTENTNEVLNTRISNASYNNGNTYINLGYDTGYGNRSNQITITPNGPATATFTKYPKDGGSATDTKLNVKVNPPTKKLELQATDVNLENEREILEWTPLSNSILGLSNANTKSIESARSTISAIEGALQVLNFDRSVFGAYQNRLEHAIKINDNTSENTQAAESIIRDTDMAREMVRFSITNILMQAGEAMMGQANQANQGVLSLIA